MHALFLALLPTIVFSFMWIFASKATKHISALNSLFLFQLLGLPVFIFFVPFMPSHVSLNVFQLLAIGVFYSFIFLLYFSAIRVGNVSVIVPISEASVIITVFLSVIFLHESFGLLKFISMIILLVGVIGVGLHLQKKAHTRLLEGVPQALLSTIGIGVYFFFVGIAARQNGWFWTALFIRIAITMTTFCLIVAQGKQKDLFKNVPWKLFILASFLDVIGFSLYNAAVTTLQVSYVSLVLCAQSLFIVVLSYLFLKEKLRFYQIISILLIVGGLIALQFS